MYVVKPSAAWHSLAAPWPVAVEEAWSAYAAGTVPVGAVVVARDGRVVARGRNRILDVAEAPQIGGTRLAHAEVNALLALAGVAEDPRGLAIYTTSEPCPLCVGAIVMANVREIHYAARDPFAGSIALLDGTPYLRSKAITVVPPLDPALEGTLKAMSVEFILRGQGPRTAEIVAACRAVRPDAVALAERFQRERTWDSLRHRSVEEGFSRVAAALGSLDS